MNDAVEKALNEEPLLGFSFHTANQNGILKALGTEIIDILNISVSDNKDGSIRVERFSEVYGKFWLWTLGAFEVVRTMVSAKVCFSDDVQKQLLSFKNKLVKLRIPFAKQQLAGRKEAIRGEASISGFDGKKKDFFFTIGDEEYWVREIIQEFNSMVKDIKRKDVLMNYYEYLDHKNG